MSASHDYKQHAVIHTTYYIALWGRGERVRIVGVRLCKCILSNGIKNVRSLCNKTCLCNAAVKKVAIYNYIGTYVSFPTLITRPVTDLILLTLVPLN